MADLILGLTGPPRIEGALYADQAEVVCRARRVQHVFEGEGRRQLLEEKLLVYGTLRWGALTEGRLLGLLSDIARPTWRLEVRTEGKNVLDTPIELVVRTTSRLPLTIPLSRRSMLTNRPAANAAIEFQALTPISLAALGLTS